MPRAAGETSVSAPLRVTWTCTSASPSAGAGSGRFASLMSGGAAGGGRRAPSPPGVDLPGTDGGRPGKVAAGTAGGAGWLGDTTATIVRGADSAGLGGTGPSEPGPAGVVAGRPGGLTTVGALPPPTLGGRSPGRTAPSPPATGVLRNRVTRASAAPYRSRSPVGSTAGGVGTVGKDGFPTSGTAATAMVGTTTGASGARGPGPTRRHTPRAAISSRAAAAANLSDTRATGKQASHVRENRRRSENRRSTATAAAILASRPAGTEAGSVVTIIPLIRSRSL
jgi:hypothetical protein